MGLNKKTVDDFNAKGRRVLVRCDFNVPLKDGEITDETRIVAALPTIKKLIADGGKSNPLLSSWQSKERTERRRVPCTGSRDVCLRSLAQEVKFVSDYQCNRRSSYQRLLTSMKDGDVVLLQNTRFRGAEETKNGEEFSKELADLADDYVCDAFRIFPQSTCFRSRCDQIHHVQKAVLVQLDI